MEREVVGRRAQRVERQQLDAQTDRHLFRNVRIVRDELHAGVGLAELPERCALPQFARWDRYPDLHVQNANRAYLRLERALFLN